MVELATGTDRPGIRLFGKLEGNNPGGSVKDRPARSMIVRAEERGELRPGVRALRTSAPALSEAFTTGARVLPQVPVFNRRLETLRNQSVT